MTKEISKSQIDRLGDRLKKENIDEADLGMLDQYRRSYTEAYEIVVGAIRKKLSLEPTGRPAKSTTSIAEKLRRESILLTQIQDIAGCRLLATDIANQNQVIQSLSSLFENVIIVDRRQQPSHGYRAVHVIVRCRKKLIEIQIRTKLQHLWAELSEKTSDVFDPAIKYGGGDESIRDDLGLAATSVFRLESTEIILAQLQERFSAPESNHELVTQIADLEEEMASIRQSIFEILRESIIDIENQRSENDFSD